MATLAIDAHAHVFHRGLPLAPERRYTPAYDAPLAAYLAQLDANGIDRGVLVQPSFLGTDNSYLLESLVAARGRLRGVVVVPPDIGREEMAWMARAGVVGVRLNLVDRDIPDLAAPPWPRFIADSVARGWHIEIQRQARDLAILAPILLAAGATVVLDHYTLPDPALGVADPGFAAILRLGATTRGLWVKISAPYRNGSHGESVARGAYPLLRDALGVDRLLWGSDWPNTGHEAGESYAKNRAFLDDLVGDPAERATVLGAGRDLFGF
jgi:predicted TIM-barrel fold metal-dependent hydrolase